MTNHGDGIVRKSTVTEIGRFQALSSKIPCFVSGLNLSLPSKATWCSKSCRQSSKHPGDRAYSLWSDVQARCPLEICGFHSKRLNCVTVSNSCMQKHYRNPTEFSNWNKDRFVLNISGQNDQEDERRQWSTIGISVYKLCIFKIKPLSWDLPILSRYHCTFVLSRYPLIMSAKRPNMNNLKITK